MQCILCKAEGNCFRRTEFVNFGRSGFKICYLFYSVFLKTVISTTRSPALPEHPLYGDACARVCERNVFSSSWNSNLNFIIKSKFQWLFCCIRTYGISFLFKVRKCTVFHVIRLISHKPILRSPSMGGQSMLQLTLPPNATVKSAAFSLPVQEFTGSNLGLQSSYLD